MAARLARQRQQRSKLRTSAVPLEDAAELAAATPVMVGSELQILRAEVAESGATISKLQTQLRQSEEEMQEMGERTARMAEELRQMREQAEAQLGGELAAGAGTAASPPSTADPIAELAKAGAPLAVSITLPQGGADGNFELDGVHVNIMPAALVKSGTAEIS